MSGPSELADTAGDMSILSAAVVVAIILTVAATVDAAVRYLRGLVDSAPSRPPPTDARVVWAAARRREAEAAAASAGSMDYPRGDYAPAG